MEQSTFSLSQADGWGLSVQKGPFEGISRKLERRTSPDTLARAQNSWLLPLFSFPLSSATFLPYSISLPGFSLPYSFFTQILTFPFRTLSLPFALLITPLLLQMWHCLDTFVLLKQTADLPKADVMLYLRKKTTMSSCRLGIMSFLVDNSRFFLLQDLWKWLMSRSD